MYRYNSGTIDFQKNIDENMKGRLIMVFGHNQLVQHNYQIYDSTLELTDFPGDIIWAVDAVVTLAKMYENPVTDIIMILADMCLKMENSDGSIRRRGIFDTLLMICSLWKQCAEG